MTMMSAPRLAPQLAARVCPDGVLYGIFSAMTGSVRRWRSLGSVSFAGMAAATLTLAACGRSVPVSELGNGPRPWNGTAASLLGRGPRGEIEAALELAHEYRAQLLRTSEFTDIGQDRCNNGWLRAFKRDSTADLREATADLVDKLEKLIQAYAVDAPMDSPEGRELLRTVVLWETGRERPRWDVWSGKPSREAIAAGLAEEVVDPSSGRCLSSFRGDTASYVLPAVSGLALPPVRGVITPMVFGERGLASLRSKYWATHVSPDSSLALAYTSVSAAMLWKEYAVVTVSRPLERRDGTALMTSNGGGTYIFHRVGSSWLLLIIARSWG
jgi:hypothetical protein